MIFRKQIQELEDLERRLRADLRAHRGEAKAHGRDAKAVRRVTRRLRAAGSPPKRRGRWEGLVIPITRELSARHLHSSVNKTLQNAPTESWVIFENAKGPGAAVQQVTLYKAPGRNWYAWTWYAWTGEFIRTEQKALAKKLEDAMNRMEKSRPSTSPYESYEDRVAREHSEVLLSRTRRQQATYQRRATGAPETFRAVASDHRGRTLGTWTGATVQGLMGKVDHELPLAKSWSVVLRGEYTSDGAWHQGHGGRVVAVREAGPGRGQGGWIIY